MGDKSGIQWTDATWNPIRGCSLVSTGCQHCYAMKAAHRMSTGAYRELTEIGSAGPRWNGQIRLVPEKLQEPLRWRRPRRVFVNSMSDLFHEDIPDAFVEKVFAVMTLARKHTFQILTKRAQSMREFMLDPRRQENVGDLAWAHPERRPHNDCYQWPPPNVCLGVSVENQHWADERIPVLLQTPAAVRFLSCEPLLGHIQLEPKLADDGVAATAGVPMPGHPAYLAPLREGIDWVIIGGESGAGARPCELGWIRSIWDQCRAASVPCFVKQLGAHVVCPSAEWTGTPQANRWGDGPQLESRKGGDPSEWPEDLRVRQYPGPGLCEHGRLGGHGCPDCAAKIED